MASILNVDKIRANGSTTDAIVINSDNYADISGQELDIWNLTTNLVRSSGLATNEIITSNLARHTGDWEKIGTGMTESSGIFTFPSTGKWEIEAQYYYTAQATARYLGGYCQISSDSGTNYTVRAAGYVGAYTGNHYSHVSFRAYVDVTNASTFRARFGSEVHNNSTLHGSTSAMSTSFTFKKIAST